MKKTPSQVINDNYKAGEILKEGMEDNKKMRVIDLLNKIANGEEVPKKIKYKGHIYQYQYKDTKEANIINYYHSEEAHHHLIDGGWHDIRLNDEVEIIEDWENIFDVLVERDNQKLKGSDKE